MNKRLFLVGLASALCCHPVFGEDPTSALQLRVDKVATSSHMTVNFNNTGKAPIRLWIAGEWSVAPWRVLHISAVSGALTTYYLDPNQVFNNTPLYQELSPNKAVQRKIDLTSSWWLPRGEARRGEDIFASGDTVIVVYDIPQSDKGNELGVWWGVVAAKAVVP